MAGESCVNTAFLPRGGFRVFSDHELCGLISQNNVGFRFVDGLDPSVSIQCNDVWANPGGNWIGMDDPTGTDGNISADPVFCLAQMDNYYLADISPCSPAHSPEGCGLIGALDVQCGSTRIAETTWGRLKARFGEKGQNAKEEE